MRSKYVKSQRQLTCLFRIANVAPAFGVPHPRRRDWPTQQPPCKWQRHHGVADRKIDDRSARRLRPPAIEVDQEQDSEREQYSRHSEASDPSIYCANTEDADHQSGGREHSTGDNDSFDFNKLSRQSADDHNALKGDQAESPLGTGCGILRCVA